MNRVYRLFSNSRNYLADKPVLNSLFLYLLGVLIGLNILARILFPGQILGLDFNLYHPDGICYTKQAFDIAGFDSPESTRLIIKKYDALNIDYVPKIDNEKCNLLKGRFLYPLLAAPFVLLFEVQGMIVASALFFLLGLYLCYLLLCQFTQHRLLAGALVMLVSCSSSLLRWGISNTTDSLIFPLSCLFFVTFLRTLGNHKLRSLYTLLCALIIVLMAVTKRSFYIPTLYSAIAILSFVSKYYSNSKKIKKLNGIRAGILISSFVLIFSIIVDFFVQWFFPKQNGSWLVTSVLKCVTSEKYSANPGSITSPIDCSDPNQSYLHQLAEAAIQAVTSIVGYITISIGQLFVLDKFLFLLLLSHLAYFLIKFREKKRLVDQISMFFPLALFLVASLNSTLGLNFRLELPCVPALLLSCLFLIQRFNLRIDSHAKS